MARRQYLIAYDISDPRRLRRVIKVMEAYGQRLQYSVFLCNLSGVELYRWRRDILHEVDLAQDSIVQIDLGTVGATVSIQWLGTARVLPHSGPTIV